MTLGLGHSGVRNEVRKENMASGYSLKSEFFKIRKKSVLGEFMGNGNQTYFEETFNLFLSPYFWRQSSPMPNADIWIQSVLTDLQKINSSRVGSILLRSIKFHGQLFWIRPQELNKCGAGVHEGEEIKFSDPNITSGPTIDFSPEFYQRNHQCQSKYKFFNGFHIESNEVLLHELVHVFRRISEKHNASDLKKGLSFYHTNEEFNAVLVQSLYASERRKKIRSSHFGHSEIDKELNSSFEFFNSGSEVFDLVKRFCKENVGFTKQLAEVNVPFNPIRAFYKNPSKAESLAKSKLARVRDFIMPLEFRAIEFMIKQLKN